jgi:hypothetical protein
VVFPCSAFAPDSIVTVIVIPEAGANMTRNVRLDQLHRMR